MCWVRFLMRCLAGKVRLVAASCAHTGGPLQSGEAARRPQHRGRRAHPDVRGVRRLERAVGEGHVVGEGAAHAARAPSTRPLSRHAPTRLRPCAALVQLLR